MEPGECARTTARQDVLEAKHAVRPLDQFEATGDFAPQLVLVVRAENVSVVLCEATHAGQAVQRACCFVPVQRGEVCKAQRQLARRARHRVEDEAVRRTAHRFERKAAAALFALAAVAVARAADNGVHVLFVVVPVSGDLPETAIEEERCAHLVVALPPQLAAKEL